MLKSLLCLAIVALAAASPADAQPTDGPVIVAMTDTLNTRDARAIILRHPRTPAKDVIVLKRAHATPQLLAAALVVLETKREKGRSDRDPEMVALQGFHTERLPAALDSAVTRTLERLRDRPPAEIGNLGSGQWIRMPSTRKSP